MIGIGPLEILVLLIIALIVIGPEKMPELARALARIMRDLRGAMDEVRDQFEELTREDLLGTKELESYYKDTIDDVKQSMEAPPEATDAAREVEESMQAPPEIKEAAEEVKESMTQLELDALIEPPKAKPEKESEEEKPHTDPSS